MRAVTMPPARIIPDTQELRRLIESGLTHQQIADMTFERTGHRVSRGAVSSAVSRAGLSAEGKRYRETLPWRVRIEHSKHYAARMLRLLGRRMRDEPLHPEDGDRLDSWMQKMKDEGTVVAYIPETEDGFYYVDPPLNVVIGEVPIIEATVHLRDIGTRVQWA